MKRSKMRLLKCSENQANEILNLEKSLEYHANEISNLDRKIAELKVMNGDLHAVNTGVLSSYSWRITKPLRSIKGLINRII